ncbi:hypothetical protein BN12_4060028 [Nostocoides japonicum T1-X7]|uniref:Uncharacterized protein n=1 Tax=Nostocoides japonicum T1-X7 TaxID=1194083 RepID=A0A077LZ94_9MICO|nr:hypothetical protein [Tetrasphaera japonica]CCH79218.1 hypothetical protein BN12_4060028 [Tetrasphaera japonica T1-X7]
MVFVRKVPGWPGSTKVQLAERGAGRDVVLEHLGRARSEAALAVLVAEARRRLRPGQEVLDFYLGEAEAISRSGVITVHEKTWRAVWAYSRKRAVRDPGPVQSREFGVA